MDDDIKKRVSTIGQPLDHVEVSGVFLLYLYVVVRIVSNSCNCNSPKKLAWEEQKPAVVQLQHLPNEDTLFCFIFFGPFKVFWMILACYYLSSSEYFEGISNNQNMPRITVFSQSDSSTFKFTLMENLTSLLYYIFLFIFFHVE